MPDQADTVTREETNEGDSIFTFRIVVTRAQMIEAKHLRLLVQDRLTELLLSAEPDDDEEAHDQSKQ